MKSQTTEKFRKAYRGLPVEIQRQAREAYRLWKTDPSHPGLHFKKVHDTKPIYSVRINLAYRTLGVKKDDTMIWFWIGSHDEYDRLLAQL
ncbi:MAG: hypothetical protein ACKVZH_18275 [Blastocatellia bacterium]